MTEYKGLNWKSESSDLLFILASLCKSINTVFLTFIFRIGLPQIEPVAAKEFCYSFDFWINYKNSILLHNYIKVSEKEAFIAFITVQGRLHIHYGCLN